MYKHEIIKSIDEIKNITLEWREFLNKVKYKDFFQDPDNIVFKAKIFHKNYNLCIIIIRDEHGIKAIAPFSIRKIRYHLTLGIIRIFSVQFNQLYLIGNQVIDHFEHEPFELITEIFKVLKELNREFDAIYIENLPLEESLYKYLLKPEIKDFSLTPINIQGKIERDWSLIIKGMFEDYLNTFSSKTRYNLKRTIKILSNITNGTNQIIKIDKPEQVRSFLFDLDQVFKNSWQAKTFGYSQRNKESDILYLESVARNGWLRSYILKCNDVPIAFTLGFQYSGKYYYEEIGYDLNWAKLAPGNVLSFLIIKDLFNYNPPEILDFGYGDSDYKSIFGNNYFHSVYIYLIKKKGLFKYVTYTQLILNTIYFNLHKIICFLQIDKYIRRLVKRKIR